MADYDDLPYVVVERRSGGFGLFLLGALIGAGIALLYAPRSGRETREQIRRGAQRLKVAAEDTVRQVQEAVAESITGLQRQVTEGLAQAREAFEEGLEAARRSRAEMERRRREEEEEADGPRLAHQRTPDA